MRARTIPPTMMPMGMSRSVIGRLGEAKIDDRLEAECLERALAALEGERLSGQLPALAQWVVGRQS